jgi:glycosyltransferase involved in cell wall biosynthesis
MTAFKKVKLIYATDSLVPSSRANAVNVVRMAEAFANIEPSFELVAYSSNPGHIESVFRKYGTKEFPIRLIRYISIKGYRYLFAIYLSILVFLKSPNCVYTRFVFGAFIFSFFGKNTILEVHSDFWRSKGSKSKFFKWALKRLRVVVISNKLKDSLLSDFPWFPDKNVLVAHDGAKLSSGKQDILKLKGDDDALKVGYTGSLHKGKGMELIAEISTLLKDEQVEFHIVGGSDELIRKWKKSINAHGVFFYGHVPHSDIPEYIAAFDICLLPNQEEISTGKKSRNISPYTSPLKLFEYMAAGKLILSSDLPVLREILNEQNAILLACNKSKIWADNILKIAGDRNVYNEKGVQALRDLKKHYTWEQRANKILNFILQ